MNPSDEIIICRCEEITLGELKKAIKEGAQNLDEIKKRTRAGMGLCQGKICETIVSQILSNELGIPLKQLTPFKGRPPVRPVLLSIFSEKRPK